MAHRDWQVTDEPEFVGLDDGFSIADEEWYGRQVDGDERPNPLSVVTAGDFTAIVEPAAESLLGTQDETILPAAGTLLMYGDGGAGKTTLTIDAICNLGSGLSWLGLEVERPVRSLVIENEGPRGKFREILGAKLSNYNGTLASSLHVLEEPWSRFSLRDRHQREQLAEEIRTKAIEVVVMGPLATVGMVGGGTPDEISAFEVLLLELREAVATPLAFWIVHHENKSGDVSGAWDRVPDTLVHVQAAGNGHTRLVFRKARWSSEFHGRTLNLLWRDGRSFEVTEPEERDYWADVLALFRGDDHWRTAKEVAKEAECRHSEAKSVLAELTRRGDLMYERGPAGRHSSAHCWRLAGLRLVDESRPTDELEWS